MKKQILSWTWMFFICAATLHSTSSFAEESHGVQRAVFVSAVSPVSNVLPGDIAPAGLTTGKALPTLLAQNCTVHSVTGTPATPEINQPPIGTFLVILDCQAAGPAPIIPVDSHPVQRAIFVNAVTLASDVLSGDTAPAGPAGNVLPALLAQNCTVHSVTGTPATPEINQPPTGTFLVILDCHEAGPAPIIK
jgi:hypothetical protein